MRALLLGDTISAGFLEKMAKRVPWELNLLRYHWHSFNLENFLKAYQDENKLYGNVTCSNVEDQGGHVT